MRKMTPPGAVISGRLTDTILARLPALARHLGPVAAGSKRLASRYANTLRAGFPVGDWAELAQSRLIFLQVPARELDPTLDRLNRSFGRWDSRVLALLDDNLDCSALASAAAAGASVASLSHLQIGKSDLAFVEGGPAALARLRSLLARGSIRVIHLQPGDKTIYSAGVNLGRLVSSALMDSVVRSLRHAGIDAATARKIAGWIADCSVADVLTRGKSANVSRNLPIPLLDEAQAEALAARDARIGKFSTQLMAAAARYCADHSLGLCEDEPESAGLSEPPHERARRRRGTVAGR